MTIYRYRRYDPGPRRSMVDGIFDLIGALTLAGVVGVALWLLK